MKTIVLRVALMLFAAVLLSEGAPSLHAMAPRPDRTGRRSLTFPGDLPLSSGPIGGSWVAGASMPRTGFGARACVVDGRVHVLGLKDSGESLNEAAVFDPVANAWGPRYTLPAWLNDFAVCALNGRIYLFGGDDGWGAREEVYSLDVATGGWVAERRLPLPRTYAAAVVLDGLVYLIGGFGSGTPGAEAPLSNVDLFDPQTGFYAAQPPLPAAVAYPSACAVDGVIYVFGGQNGEVYAFDSDVHQWTIRTAGVHACMNPEAVEAIDGLIYLFEPGATIVYDPQRNQFRLGAPMPTPRYDATCAAVDGRVYILGGSSGPSERVDGANPFIVYAHNEVFTPATDRPVISSSPLSQTVTASGSLTLAVTMADEWDPVSYQWKRDGVDIPGATGATLTLPCVQRCHAGAYSVVVTNHFGSATSAVAQVDVEPPAPSGARLLNLSSRALCLTGEEVLLPGFVITGAGTKQLLLRVVGPKLAEFGTSGALINPMLQLRRLDGGVWVNVAANDDWFFQRDGGNSDLVAGAAQRVGAFALDPAGRDAALLVDLPPGVYSMAGAGYDGCTGLELVEIYDADRAAAGPGTARLANLSVRGFVGTGAEVMIPGFIVSSEGPMTVLLRAIGPGLQTFGVDGVLADPKLTLFRRMDVDTPVDQRIAESDNWSDGDGAFTVAVAEEVGAFALAVGSKDAAMVVTLPPGVYTAVASGADSPSAGSGQAGTGVALVEIYEVP